MILESGALRRESEERLLEPVEGAALDSGGQLGVDRVEDAGGPGPHDHREVDAGALGVLGSGLLDRIRVRLRFSYTASAR